MELGWVLRAYSPVPIPVCLLCFVFTSEDVTAQQPVPAAMPPHYDEPASLWNHKITPFFHKSFVEIGRAHV